MVDEAAPGRPLDATDRAIIRLLTVDGRMSVNELAGRVNISRASAYSRLERLRTTGVIEGFTARVNPSKVGLEIAALIFVNADQHGWKALQHKLLDLPGLEHLAVTIADQIVSRVALYASRGGRPPVAPPASGAPAAQ